MNEQVMSFLPMILVLAVFYFLVMRPQQKKMKAHQAMLASLKVGDHVILASGFAGQITKIEERFVTVELRRRVDNCLGTGL